MKVHKNGEWPEPMRMKLLSVALQIVQCLARQQEERDGDRDTEKQRERIPR